MNILTSGLPYANGDLHLGHLYEWFLSDTLSRLSKHTHSPLVWITGDDAHGVAVLNSARNNNTDPTQWVNTLTNTRRVFLYTLPFETHLYGSTASPYHHAFVQNAYNTCVEKGLIVEKECHQYFHNDVPVFERDVVGLCRYCNHQQYLGVCENCQQTLEAGDLLDPVHTRTKEPVTINSVSLAHFHWGVFRSTVRDWVESNAPESVKNKVLNDLEALPDLWCIERPGAYFGVPVPNREGHFYVWFDALLGYFSFAEHFGFGATDGFVHVIGKDILTFHALRLPALCAALDLPLPKTLVVHGHVTDKNHLKLSKSLGNAPDLSVLRSHWSDDVLRYYLLKNTRSSLSDIPFDETFLQQCQNKLANTLGNTYRRLHKIASATQVTITNEHTVLLNAWDQLREQTIVSGNTARWIERGEELVSQLVAQLQNERWWEEHNKHIAQEGFSFFCQILYRFADVLPETTQTIVQRIERGETCLEDDLFISKC